MFFLQNTKVGFWMIGGLLSVFWGFVFSLFAYDISGKDEIWTYVVWGLGTALMIGLHLRARARNQETDTTVYVVKR
jgi:FtsH-binding integral membrane protein